MPRYRLVTNDMSSGGFEEFSAADDDEARVVSLATAAARSARVLTLEEYRDFWNSRVLKLEAE